MAILETFWKYSGDFPKICAVFFLYDRTRLYGRSVSKKQHYSSVSRASDGQPEGLCSVPLSDSDFADYSNPIKNFG